MKTIYLALATAVALLALCLFPGRVELARALDDAAVKVVVKGARGSGHGSGVILKDGYVLTAAHVVADKDGERKITVNGAEALILWASEPHDVALLQVQVQAPKRELSCRDLDIGERLWTSGYPMDLPGPVTSSGLVSSRTGKLKDTQWREFVTTDMVMTGGISGAGVLDQGGKVVGISVGNFGNWIASDFGEPVGFIPVGYNVVIPSTTVCKLLMR
jgi:S1-C subfamily serine protease